MSWIAGIGRVAFTLAMIATLSFALVRIAPGDPVDSIAGDTATAEDRAAVEQALGLDQPLSKQYLSFWGHIFDTSLGQSFRKRTRSVSSLIAEALPSTVELAFFALLFAWLFGVPLGLIAGANRGRLSDTVAMAAANLGIAIPNLWLGPLLILIIAMHLRWLPVPGDLHASWQQLVLPVITLGSAMAAALARQMRASTIATEQQLFVTAAKARGLSRSRVLFGHVLRNAIYPVVTVGAAQVAALLSGAVVTEKVFERPGLGSLFLESFFARDFPVVQGCILVFGSIFVLVYTLLDLLQRWLDPRIGARS